MISSVRLAMLRAVEFDDEFDDEFAGEADEVDDVRTHRSLAAELVAVELAGAQEAPDGSLCRGLSP